MSEKPIFDTICLSGGGIKGISFLGALDYLQFNSYINLNNIINEHLSLLNNIKIKNIIKKNIN